jgi:hypothetical protein
MKEVNLIKHLEKGSNQQEKMSTPINYLTLNKDNFPKMILKLRIE